MAQAGASLIVYFTTSLLLLTYFLFFPKTLKNVATVPSYLRPTLSVLLIIHTLVVLYSIIILPPPNLFTLLHLPLVTPSDSIRSLLLRISDDPASGLPRSIEQVLTRLGSFEMRVLYVRFGHEVIATCDYCQSWTDFAVYALPGPLLSYTQEFALIGAITLKGTRHSHHRTLGMGVLLAAALVEVYWTLTVTIKIPKEVFNSEPSYSWENFGGFISFGVVMWHDVLLFLRRLVFLFLPLVIHFYLQPSPPPFSSSSPDVAIPTNPENLALHTLQGLITKLHLLRYTHGAVNRHPALREAAGTWWAAERKEGEWVREDREVKRVAKGLGIGYEEDESPLKKSAKMVVKDLMKGFVPSVFWKPVGGPVTGASGAGGSSSSSSGS